MQSIANIPKLYEMVDFGHRENIGAIFGKKEVNMANFVERKFIKFHLGDKGIRTHIDALHAAPPCSDKYTGEIVEGVIKEINCHGIIATVSRTIADLNRLPNQKNEEAIKEYRQTIKDILEHIGILNENEKLIKPYLHLAIHGIRNTVHGPLSIEIGTRSGKTCSSEVKDWFIEKLKGCNLKIQIDKNKIGDSSKIVHRWGDKISGLYYFGYGSDFNTFQIEISRTLREKHKNDLIYLFSDIIISFNEAFE